MASRVGGLSHHHQLLFLLFFTLVSNALLTCVSHATTTRTDVTLRPLMRSEIRRQLGGFQVCAVCTCCGGEKRRICVASPCCYAINCNIPNRPFGVCSFTPKSCNQQSMGQEATMKSFWNLAALLLAASSLHVDCWVIEP